MKTVLDDVKPTDSPDDDEVPPTVETEPDDKEMEEGGSALYSSVKNENEDDESDEGMSFEKHLFRKSSNFLQIFLTMIFMSSKQKKIC